MKKKRFTILVFLTLAISLSGQNKSKEYSDQVIGSATLIRKPTPVNFDRWELGFHDSNYKNQLLWFLAKSEKGKKLNSGTYRIRKKPFDKMQMRDLLGLAFYKEKEYPVIRGKVSFDFTSSQIIMKAKVKINQLGKKRFYYEGKYKIIEAQ